MWRKKVPGEEHLRKKMPSEKICIFLRTERSVWLEGSEWDERDIKWGQNSKISHGKPHWPS